MCRFATLKLPAGFNIHRCRFYITLSGTAPKVRRFETQEKIDFACRKSTLPVDKKNP